MIGCTSLMSAGGCAHDNVLVFTVYGAMLAVMEATGFAFPVHLSTFRIAFALLNLHSRWIAIILAVKLLLSKLFAPDYPVFPCMPLAFFLW